MQTLRLTAVLALALALPGAAPKPATIRDQALATLKKAATYYHSKVARHGGYVYYTSPDLSERWGEGKHSVETVEVQPPGTPAVGMAYLKAYNATKDPFYLEAAKDAALCLVQGQLKSGGWRHTIHFAPPAKGQMGDYRKRAGGSDKRSSLDDDQTQSAMQCLIQADEALEQKNAEIHEAALFALDGLMKAQFANGAFPQGWVGPAPVHPIVKPKYPDYEWRTFKKEEYHKSYWDYYTLNDDLATTLCDTLLEAIRVYKDPKHTEALKKLGDFLILAQMPDPQPGWCQQYNYEMIPIWARKFEPPGLSGGEGQGVMETLMVIHQKTGDKKYLEPLPRAIEYYKKSLLPDGQFARYYELKTNKPLYMVRKSKELYELTYDDSNLPTHYGFKRPSRLAAIEAEYKRLTSGAAPAPAAPARTPAELEAAVKKAIAALDGEGRWITISDGGKIVGQPDFKAGTKFIDGRAFNENVATLSEYLAQTK